LKEELHITLLQADLHWEHPSANLEMFDEMIFNAGETDIIVLPEMFTTGFTMNAYSLAENNESQVIDWMKIMAVKKQAVITGSIIVEANTKYYNRLFWVEPSGKKFSYDKRHLFRMAEEDKTYSAGKNRLIVEYKGWRICPLVCYDLRFPVWGRNRNFAKDENHVETKSLDKTAYDLLIYVANWPEARSKPWKTLLEARAMENQCYVAGVNRVGEDGKGIKYSGDSLIFDFKGESLSSAKAGGVSTLHASLSLKDLKDFRQKFPAWMDADEVEIN